MFDILRKAGPVGIPLLICSIVAVAISLEKLLYFIWFNEYFKIASNVEMDHNSGISEAAAIVRRTRGPVAAVLLAGLSTNSSERVISKLQCRWLLRKNCKPEKRLRTLGYCHDIASFRIVGNSNWHYQ